MKSGFFLKSGLRNTVILILCAGFSSCSSGEIISAPPALTTEAVTEKLRTYIWETEPETAEFKQSDYEYDLKPYAVTAGQRNMLTAPAYEAYCRTIDAFLNASETVEMTADQADAVVPALAECFPPVWLAESLAFVPGAADVLPEETAAETEAGSSGERNPVKGILEITYKYDKTEHAQNIGSFFGRTAFIMNDSGAAAAANGEIAAILLYRYAAKTVTDVAGKRTSSYDAIMYGTDETDGDIKYTGGGSHTLAYIYLLLQAGIDCTAVTGMFDNSPRMLCAVINGGNLFYCDPAGEMNVTMGAGLKYFGLNDADLLAEGLTAPLETCPVPLFLFYYIQTAAGSGDPAEAEEPEKSEEKQQPVPSFSLISDNIRYGIFRGSNYFEFDAAKSEITVYYEEHFDSAVFVCS